MAKKKRSTARAEAKPKKAPESKRTGTGASPALARTESARSLSSSTAEFVRLVARQTRSRARSAALVLALVLVAASAAGYFLFIRPSPPASLPPAPARAGDEAPAPGGGGSATNPREAKEALKKAPKSIASLLNGQRPNHAVGPAPDGIAGGPHAGRVNAYDLARAIANDRKGAVQLCYERELKRNPHLKGHVTVDLQLKAPHEIGALRVVDNLRRASFTRCVQNAMRHLDFPPLAEDLAFEIPFALTSPDL